MLISLQAKKKHFDKENYRSVTVLSHMSKIFERVMHTQIENFINSKFSTLLTGLQKS